MPCVVHLRVVVLHGADERGRPERRADPQGLASGEVLVPRESGVVLGGAGHRVVEAEPSLDIGSFDDRLGQRVEEGHGSHEVGGKTSEEQPPFLEGFGDELEVEHLQVAQPPVDELAAATGGARGEVALFDESGGEASGHRVEGAASPRHAPADDEDVEFPPAGELVDRRAPVCR